MNETSKKRNKTFLIMFSCIYIVLTILSFIFQGRIHFAVIFVFHGICFTIFLLYFLLKKHRKILFSILLIAMIPAYLFSTMFAITYMSNGISMEPTIKVGNVTLTWQLNFTPKRGDIVFIEAGVDNTSRLFKRVAGLPGDTIKITPYNRAFINNFDTEYMCTETGAFRIRNAIVESYLVEENTMWVLYGKIPSDFYFVAGDNLQVSMDSKYFGFIHKSQIKGKILYIF